MSSSAISEQIRGKTFRFTWTEGLSEGSSVEYDFDEEGIVEWKQSTREKPKQGLRARRARRARRAVKHVPGSGVAVANTAHYIAADAGKHVCLVSYRAQSGFVLTAALNMRTGKFAGVASNQENWQAVKGTFEPIGHWRTARSSRSTKGFPATPLRSSSFW